MAAVDDRAAAVVAAWVGPNGASAAPLAGPIVPTWKGPEASRLGRVALDHGLGPEPFIVDGLLPVDAVGLVGVGGLGKSSLLLWLLARITLCMPVFGAAVLRPGPVLVITAEDREDTVVRRLQWIVGEHGLGLSRAEQEQVFERVHVEDVSAIGVRLVADMQGTVSATNAADLLIEQYREAKLSVVVLDPLSLLGAGERSGNDGMAEMMRTARRVSRELNCAVIVVHHEAKAGAREGVADQYAGRGGAAFADNSRGNWQVVPTSGLAVEYAGQRWAVPKDFATQDDVGAGNLLVVYMHKITGARRDRRPIFVLRHGWRYDAAHAVALDGRESAEDAASELRRLICDFTAEQLRLSPPVTHSPTSLAYACAAAKIGGRDACRVQIHALVAQGLLIELPLPANRCRGSKGSYLVPASAMQHTLPIR